jgi:hypothetical protein
LHRHSRVVWGQVMQGVTPEETVSHLRHAIEGLFRGVEHSANLLEDASKEFPVGSAGRLQMYEQARYLREDLLPRYRQAFSIGKAAASNPEASQSVDGVATEAGEV